MSSRSRKNDYSRIHHALRRQFKNFGFTNGETLENIHYAWRNALGDGLIADYLRDGRSDPLSAAQMRHCYERARYIEAVARGSHAPAPTPAPAVAAAAAAAAPQAPAPAAAAAQPATRAGTRFLPIDVDQVRERLHSFYAAQPEARCRISALPAPAPALAQQQQQQQQQDADEEPWVPRLRDVRARAASPSVPSAAASASTRASAPRHALCAWEEVNDWSSSTDDDDEEEEDDDMTDAPQQAAAPRQQHSPPSRPPLTSVQPAADKVHKVDKVQGPAGQKTYTSWVLVQLEKSLAAARSECDCEHGDCHCRMSDRICYLEEQIVATRRGMLALLREERDAIDLKIKSLSGKI